ncbi:uncharacterized protein LOC133502257 isoform X4 [Syngnathoides biaculeatus]|uniref:uncharacterized protein LOC133502257 isoform X4 n=1 Tax=Syngnathoides biaculeatus TaxID=300417 RepID=UPI002ADE5CBA|nr:uncharacterized protein LOC133502257 isoform X4 [Syngnathoides biaculeatus]
MSKFVDMYFGATKWSDGLSCQVCLSKCKIFAEFKRHISSKGHQKKMAEVFETEGHSFSGKLPHIIVMDRAIQKTIHQPLLGLQLLTVCFSQGVANVVYLCHICQETVLHHKILEHLKSGGHEFTYYSYPDANMLEISWIPSEEVRVNPGMRKMLEHSNISGVGPLKMLNLPYRLISNFEKYSYFEVMDALALYEKLPTLLKDVKPKKVPVHEQQEDSRKNFLPLDPSEKSYKIHCQNCKLPLDTPQQYFEHVKNKKHKMRVKILYVHSSGQSACAAAETQERGGHESQTPEQLLFDELDKRSVPGASMLVLCYSSEAISEAVCFCCACQDAFSRPLLIKHLTSHKHLLQTLLYLNPWRLPFGWREVPERDFLEAKVEAEEKERGWTRVVLKVMDLPASVLRSIIPPSYQKVLDGLVPHLVVLKWNVPPCQTFSQLREHKAFPLLGRNFMVSHEAPDSAAPDSVLCLLCGRRLTHREGYAHAFSWEHVSTFLERFHPGSLTPLSDAKELLDLATQAADIHSVSHIQKIKLERPIEEPCDYVKVKLMLNAAKRNSKSSLMPLVLPQAPLVPKQTVTPGNSMKSKIAASPSRKAIQNPANSCWTPVTKNTADETGQQRSGHVRMSTNEERERKRPSATLDDKTGYKRQRSSGEIAPHEEKPKMKYKSCEQKETATASGSNTAKATVPVAGSTETSPKPSTLCTSVARSKFTGIKSTDSTTSCATKPRMATTSIPSVPLATQSVPPPSRSATKSSRATATTEMSCGASATATKSTVSTSSSTKSCVTTAASGAPPFPGKSMTPPASTAQSCRVTETYSSVTSTSTKSTASTASSTKACRVLAMSASATSTASQTGCTTSSSRVTATALIHGATAAKSITPVAGFAGPTSKLTETISQPKMSFRVGHKASKERTERERHSNTMSWRNPAHASKTSGPSDGGVATAAVAALKSRKSGSSSNKANNARGPHDDAEPRVTDRPPDVRHATATAKQSYSRAKPTFSKVGLSFIVAVNSDGRKQSYCTLCRIRLECSSHPTENIHLHNYVKRRFPELNDEQLIRINREKFAFSMTEVEKCLGLRNIQTIEVSNDEYKVLSDLPEAQALQRLETHFLVLSNTWVPLGHGSPTSLQGLSSLEGAFDTGTHERTAAEPEATVHSIDRYKCGKETGKRREIDDDASKSAEENLDGFEEPLTSVSFGPYPQIDDPGLRDSPKSLEGSDVASASLLLGPELKLGGPGSQDNKENLSGFKETSLGPEPLFDDPPLTDVEVNLEVSDCPSPSELLGPEPQFGNPPLKQDDEGLEGCHDRFSPLLPLGPDLRPASANAGPQSSCVSSTNEGWSSLHNVPTDASSNCGHSTSQATILSGSTSNLATFLWVKGSSNNPVIGLVTVYECRGTPGNVFYLCKSCSQKLILGEICQHVISVTHRLAYMLRAYPQYMDAFWYEEDIGEEMKLELLNDVAIYVAAQERSKKMDAKVIDLPQDLYEYMWNAPFGEALSFLQSAIRQPVVASQQTARTNLSPQESLRSSHIPPELPVSDVFSKTPPAVQVKDELIPSECNPLQKFVSGTKTSPVFQVKSEPLLESKPPKSPGPTCEEQPSLQVKAELMAQESVTAKEISEKQPSSQIKAEIKPTKSGFGATAVKPNFQVKVERVLPETACTNSEEPLIKAEFLPQRSPETCSTISEPQASCHVKAELMLQQSGSPEVDDPIAKGMPNFQVKAELMPEASPETPGPILEEQATFKVNTELRLQNYSTPETILKKEPGYQVNAKSTFLESSSPVTADMLKTPPICQVKDEVVLLSCGSPITAGPGSETLPGSKVKDETGLSNVSISKSQQSSQMNNDLMRSDCRTLVTATPVTKKSSTFQDSEGFAHVTTSSTIRQDEYIPTRKRESLQSLDELIRICISKTQLCDAPPAKWRRKSLEANLAKSPNVHPPLTPGEPALVDQGASGVENRNPEGNFSSQAEDGIAVITSNPAAQVSHLSSVQPITTIVTRKSRQNLKNCKMAPSKTPGTRPVAPPPHLSSSSLQDRFLMEDKSTNTTISRDPECQDRSEVKSELVDICVSSGPDGVAVPRANAYASPFSANSIQNCKLDRETEITLNGAQSGPGEAQLSDPNDSAGFGNRIPCVTNMYSRYAHALPAAGQSTPSSLQTVKENGGQSYPVQFYLQQTANNFIVPFSGHHQTVTGLANQQTQQWVPQQQYPSTWLQAARNVTNGATYLYTFPVAAAAYSGRPVTLVPVSSQGDCIVSQPSYSTLRPLQSSQKK